MISLAAITLASALQTAALPNKLIFPRLEAHHHSGKQESEWKCFWFSESPATSDSPVIISGINHSLTFEDRAERVDLQKYWLSKNVPEPYELVVRWQVECGLVRKGEYSLCDQYTYLDPVTKKEHDYYIYIGNWPGE